MPEKPVKPHQDSRPDHAPRRPAEPDSLRLLTDRAIDDLGDAVRQRMLGALRYTACSDPGSAPPRDFPVCDVPLQTLERDATSVVLLGQGPAERIGAGDVACCTDGEILFGTVSEPSATPEGIEATTYRLYQRLLHIPAQLGFPHVGRIWNYLPEINTEVNGLEVYRAFSVGRRRAFDESGRVTDANLPAACAIGTRRPGMRIAFLASRRAGTALSNARQHEAYRYPPRYGPKSPAFSRAALLPHGARRTLHISGTASIVGHETVHVGSVHRQIDETLRNLAALLQPLGLHLCDADAGAVLTIYLRRPEDLPLAQTVLAATLSPEAKRLFVQGDICRRSLLVEIEGIITGF